jgi:hypothetical protein
MTILPLTDKEILFHFVIFVFMSSQGLSASSSSMNSVRLARTSASISVRFHLGSRSFLCLEGAPPSPSLLLTAVFRFPRLTVAFG